MSQEWTCSAYRMVGTAKEQGILTMSAQQIRFLVLATKKEVTVLTSSLMGW